MIDRLPPQSLEAEQSVLGAILIDRETIIEIAEFLRPEDFYRQAHATVYRAMLDLFERREPVDIVTVAETLERKGELEGIGGRESSWMVPRWLWTTCGGLRGGRQPTAGSACASRAQGGVEQLSERTETSVSEGAQTTTPGSAVPALPNRGGE